jgi:hypothetical protein
MASYDMASNVWQALGFGGGGSGGGRGGVQGRLAALERAGDDAGAVMAGAYTRPLSSSS